MAGRDVQELLNLVFDTTNNALKVSSSGTSSAVDPWGIPRTIADLAGKTDTGQGVGSANTAIYIRWFTGGVACTKIAFGSFGTASGNIDVGHYTATGTGRSAKPGALVTSSGSIPCPATGYTEVTMGASFTPAAGDFAAFAADATTLTLRGPINAGGGQTIQQGAAWSKASAFPLATNPAPSTIWSGLPLLIGVP